MLSINLLSGSLLSIRAIFWSISYILLTGFNNKSIIDLMLSVNFLSGSLLSIRDLFLGVTLFY